MRMLCLFTNEDAHLLWRSGFCCTEQSTKRYTWSLTREMWNECINTKLWNTGISFQCDALLKGRITVALRPLLTSLQWSGFYSQRRLIDIVGLMVFWDLLELFHYSDILACITSKNGEAWWESIFLLVLSLLFFCENIFWRMIGAS